MEGLKKHLRVSSLLIFKRVPLHLQFLFQFVFNTCQFIAEVHIIFIVRSHSHGYYYNYQTIINLWSRLAPSALILSCNLRSAEELLLGRLALASTLCLCMPLPCTTRSGKMPKPPYSCWEIPPMSRLSWTFCRKPVLQHWNHVSAVPNLHRWKNTIIGIPEGMVAEGRVEIKSIGEGNSYFEFVFSSVVGQNLPVVDTWSVASIANGGPEEIALLFQEAMCVALG